MTKAPDEQRASCRRRLVIGVAEYQLVEALPKNLQTELPSIEEIETRLAEDFAAR